MFSFPQFWTITFPFKMIAVPPPLSYSQNMVWQHSALSYGLEGGVSLLHIQGNSALFTRKTFFLGLLKVCCLKCWLILTTDR